MSHLGNNIKIIRALSKKTQPQFAALMGEEITEAMQKSYESEKAKPSVLYMQALSELAGVPIKQLTDRELKRGDITIDIDKLSVEKVDEAKRQYIANNPLPGHATLQDLLDEKEKRIAELATYKAELQADKDRLFNNNEILARALEKLGDVYELILANSNATKEKLDEMDQSMRINQNIMIGSLEEIAGKQPGTLLKEGDNVERALDTLKKGGGKNKGAGKKHKQESGS